MAKANVYIISIILMAIALLSTSSHGITLGNLRLGQREIYGVFRCDLSGDSNAPPVSGAPVNLRCRGSSTNICEAVTNPDGTFKVVVSTLDTLFVNPSNCYLLANLPGGNCSIFVPDGFLTATFRLVSLIQRNNVDTAVFLANDFTEGIL